MAYYEIIWFDERLVTSLIKGKSEKDAKNKLLEGKADEIDWSGSAQPDDIDAITKIKKISKEEYDKLI